MQTVSLSVYRFARPGAMHWALWQMPLAMPKLRRLPGAGFVKTLGSGTGESFVPVPNFAVYGVLVTWPSLAHARAQVAGAEVYRRYAEQSVEAFHVYLTAVSARGLWAGVAPFEVPEGLSPAPPYAILTRASIKWWKAPAFWRHSPRIDRRTAEEPGILFKRGLGELPWIRQVTFSIWSDMEAMREFAYRHPYHREAARMAKEGGWFSEELFARFRVTHAEGSWEGRNPLEGALVPLAEPEPA